jgi:hypothetical protein
MSRYIVRLIVGAACCVLTMSAARSAEIRLLRDQATKQIIGASGLSDNDSCFDDHDAGTVERQRTENGKMVGFFYRDRKNRSSYVNTSLYHGTAAQRAQVMAWLQQVVLPKVEVQLGVKVCGAGGRIVELDTIEVIRPTQASAAVAPAINSATSPLAGTSPSDGQWQYGHHPVLGLSAHVNVGDDAIGLACTFTGVDLMRGDAVSIRMTPGVAASATNQFGVLMFYNRGIGGGNYAFSRKGAYVEYHENACGILPALQKSSRLMVVEGKQISLSWKPTTSSAVAEIEQRGVRKTIASEQDFQQFTDFREFPLKGSGAAIRQLIDACPAIKADIRNECGV